MQTLPKITVTGAEQVAASVVAPEMLEGLEKNFATKVGRGTEEALRQHLTNSFAQPSASTGISQLAAGAVEVTSQIEGAAYKVNNSLMVGIPAAAIIPKTGTPIDMITQMLPIEVIAGFAIGAVDKVGGIIGGTVAAAGGAIGLKGVKNFGEGITNNTLKATSVPHAICETVGAPINHLRDSNVSEAHCVVSSGIKHVSQQLDKFVARKEIAIPNDITIQPPLFDVEKYSIENSAQIRPGILKTAFKTAENFEQAAGNKISGAVDAVLGDNSGKVKDWAQNASIHRTAMQGTAIISSVAQNVKTANVFIEEYKKLEDFYRDVKGLAPDARVIPKDVLTNGDVSNIYKEARDQILVKAPLAVVASLASNMGSWTMACNQNVNGIQGFGAMMGIAMATQAAMGLVMPKSPILDLHEIATQVYAAKGELPASLIADFITTAVPEFAGKSNEIKAQVLAEHYHKLGTSPQSLLQEITSGQIAATAYLITDARNEKMAANDLTDYNAETRVMQRLSKDSPTAIPTEHVYSYTMINNATDENTMQTAIAGFVCESQPSFNQGGVNAGRLDAVAGYVAQKVIAGEIPPEELVTNSSADIIMEAMEHLQAQAIPQNNVTKLTLQGRATAPTSNKIGVYA